MPSLEEQAVMNGMTPDEAMQSGIILKRLMANPATRGRALAIYKENFPDEAIPEVDLPHTFETQLKPIKEQLDSLVRENSELRLSNSRKGILEDLVEKGEASNMAEAREIEKFAVDNKIADYGKAAHFFHMSRKQAEPTPDFTVHGGPLELPIDFKDIAKNPRSWAQKAGIAAMNDFRKANKAA